MSFAFTIKITYEENEMIGVSEFIESITDTVHNFGFMFSRDNTEILEYNSRENYIKIVFLEHDNERFMYEAILDSFINIEYSTGKKFKIVNVDWDGLDLHSDISS